MTEQIFKINYLPPDVNIKEVLRYAGCKSSDETVLKVIKSCLEEIESIIKYDICFGEFSVSVNEKSVSFPFAEVFSEDLVKNLSDSSSVIIFAATLGMEIDRVIKKYSRISPSRAVIVQAIGAERIEALCDIFCDDLKRKMMLDNAEIKPRFSPGYGDLPLQFQKELFSALDCPKNIGISLNESFLISPSKSVTAIIGISR